jgi:hypothetical protein
MPLQDLTPQLRTRLNKMERAVGWFVFLATVLLLTGFGYYLYHAAERKGWFLVKAKFFTYIKDASGLNVGDPVVLMGFQVGQITGIAAMPPRTPHNVRLEFVVNQVNKGGQPYYSYIWSEGSVVKLNADFLGKHSLEITRGTNGFGIYTTHPLETLSLAQAQSLPDPDRWRLAENLYDENSNLVFRAFSSLVQSNLTRIAELKPESILAFHTPVNDRHIAAVWNDSLRHYQNFDYRNEDETNAYELRFAETPAIADQLQTIVSQVQGALPGIFALTNKLSVVLDNTANATSNLNTAIVAAQPLVTNFAAISAQLREPGGLGVWALGPNGNGQVQGALTNLNSLLVGVDTNLNALTANIGVTLDNIAGITSNLNMQVQANSNLLWGISKTVTDADDFVQGLKRHWLLRSAFKTKATNQPPTKVK